VAGPKTADRVKETTTSTGTGTVTLAGAVAGYRSFGDALSSGDTCLYCIAHQTATEWETGIGTYTAAGTTLARTTVLSSSNSGSAVNFSVGIKDVLIGPTSAYPDKVINPSDTSANIGSTGFQSGRVCYPTDGFAILRDTGSAFTPYGPLFPFTPPVNANFSWVNQGTATVTDYKHSIVLDDVSAGNTHQLRCRAKAIPSTPYTVDAAFLWCADVRQSYPGVGLFWRDSSSGRLVTFWLLLTGGGITISFDKFTNPTTYSSGYMNAAAYQRTFGPIWLRIKDDNTNFSVWIGANGKDWIQVDSNRSRTDFLASPDQIGFFIDPMNTGANMTLLHWKES
jgi:hypothetical protein